jgi:hypothetical protein
MSPVKYELGLYIPEDDILHSHHGENRKRYSFIMSSNSTWTPSTLSKRRPLGLQCHFQKSYGQGLLSREVEEWLLFPLSHKLPDKE